MKKYSFYIKLFVNAIFKLSAIFLGVFTSRWLNNNLSSSDRSDYSSILAYNSIILLVINFGLPFLIQKYYTNTDKDDDDGGFWTTAFAIRVFSYLAGLLIIVVSFPLSKVANLSTIIGIFTAQFILLADQSYASVANAKGEIWKFSTTDFLAKLMLVVSLYSARLFIKDASISGIGFFINFSILAYLIVLVIDHFINRRNIVWGKIKFSIIQSNYKQLLYTAATSFILGLYLKTDILFLKNLNFSDQVINGYDNAYKIFDIAAVIAGTTVPSLSSMVKKQVDKSDNKQKILWQYVLYMILFGVLLCAAVIIFKDLALFIISADQRYPLSKEALPILALALITVPVSYYIANLLIFTGHEKLDFYSVIISTVITLTLYSIFIPIWGMKGAAYATVISYTLDSLVKLLLLRIVAKKLNNNV